MSIPGIQSVTTSALFLVPLLETKVKENGERVAFASDGAREYAPSHFLYGLCQDAYSGDSSDVAEVLGYAEDAARILYSVEQDVFGFKDGLRVAEVHDTILSFSMAGEHSSRPTVLDSLARYRSDSCYLGLRYSDGDLALARVWENENKVVREFAERHLQTLVTNAPDT